jgi:hypothetical protein
MSIVHDMPSVRVGARLLLAAMALAVTVQARGLARQNPASSPAGQSDQPMTGTGLLMGTVVDSANDQPVSGSLVMLGAGITPMSSLVNPQFSQETLSGANLLVLTDAQGRFVFSDLPKATYTISVSKAGYTNGAYGRRRVLGPPQLLPLADGERIGDLKIPIWKNATITGTITDEAGEPMVDVSVRILLRTLVAGKRALGPGGIVRTDDRGFYRVASLTPGEYVIAVPSTQVSAPGSIVDLYRSAQASGTMADFSRAFSGVNSLMNVVVASRGFTIGGIAFQSSMGAMGGSPAAVAPEPSGDGRISVYPTQYYPAALTAGLATVIRLGSGEQRSGVDLQLKLVPTSRVSGTVTSGEGPLSVDLSLVPSGDDVSTDANFETATTLSDAAGAFTFLGVPSGQYVLRVLRVPPLTPPVANGAIGPSVPTTPTLWATVPISVERSDVQDVAVSLHGGFRVSGRMEFDDEAKKPLPDQVRRILATFDPADGRPPGVFNMVQGRFDADGRLSSYELVPGKYFLRINNPPAGWTLKSAMFDGHDISNVPLSLDGDVSGVVITFTDRVSEINGSVQRGAGAKDAGATVLIFPAESTSWTDYGANPRRLRSVRADKDGVYRATGLPAGNYLVIAVSDESVNNWQDPASLQALARLATTVRLADGETRSQDLKTVMVPR